MVILRSFSCLLLSRNCCAVYLSGLSPARAAAEAAMARAIAEAALQIPLTIAGIAFAGGAVAGLKISTGRQIGAGSAAFCAVAAIAPATGTRFSAAATALLATSGAQAFVAELLGPSAAGGAGGAGRRAGPGEGAGGRRTRIRGGRQGSGCLAADCLLAVMVAAVCQPAATVVAVVLPGQCTAGVALLAPLPVGAVTVAVIVLHLSDIVGVVVAQHSIALPGAAAEQPGVPPPAQAAGNTAGHFPVRPGYFGSGLRLQVYIDPFSFYRTILEFAVEGSAILEIQGTKATRLSILRHAHIKHIRSVIMGRAAGLRLFHHIAGTVAPSECSIHCFPVGICIGTFPTGMAVFEAAGISAAIGKSQRSLAAGDLVGKLSFVSAAIFPLPLSARI